MLIGLVEYRSGPTLSSTILLSLSSRTVVYILLDSFRMYCAAPVDAHLPHHTTRHDTTCSSQSVGQSVSKDLKGSNE